MSKEAKKLPQHLADKYNLRPNAEAGRFLFRTQLVDLQKITLKQAEKLVAAGFKILVPKPEPKAGKP